MRRPPNVMNQERSFGTSSGQKYASTVRQERGVAFLFEEEELVTRQLQVLRHGLLVLGRQDGWGDARVASLFTENRVACCVRPRFA